MTVSNLHIIPWFQTDLIIWSVPELGCFLQGFFCGFGEKNVLFKVKLSLFVWICFFKHKDVIFNLAHLETLQQETWKIDLYAYPITLIILAYVM